MVCLTSFNIFVIFNLSLILCETPLVFGAGKEGNRQGNNKKSDRGKSGGKGAGTASSANTNAVNLNNATEAAAGSGADFCTTRFPQFKPVTAGAFDSPSCSSTPQGILPDVSRMVSTLITSPQDGSTIDIGKQSMSVSVSTVNLASGSIGTKPFQESQTVQSKNNVILGHVQLTIQKLESFGQTAPDAQTFVFFKRLVTPNVKISSAVFSENGLYRVCTMIATTSLQPIIMPVAQRGSQDDCVRVNVVGASGGVNKPVVE